MYNSDNNNSNFANQTSTDDGRVRSELVMTEKRAVTTDIYVHRKLAYPL